uniref:Uncharacterized protein n=1 Tax=Pristionchus pacificus TaxID=54126 RepID=A0A2A6B4E3_PRIPA|eukprot:PDM60747.1 hypothetical protein PRIPAC_54553 [Pristionchus pacificus]
MHGIQKEDDFEIFRESSGSRLFEDVIIHVLELSKICSMPSDFSQPEDAEPEKRPAENNSRSAGAD